MDAQAILDRFQNVSECSDGGYIASCTAHNDSNPSLRIWIDKEKTRFKCRAGCETKDVIRAVDLSWRDLFNTTGAPRTVSSTPASPVGTGEIAALRMFLDTNSLDENGYEYLWD